MFTSIPFNISLVEVHNCLQWRVSHFAFLLIDSFNLIPFLQDEYTKEKIAELIDEITFQLRNVCGCSLSTSHIANGVFLCDPEFSSKVILNGKIILPEDRNTSELKKDLIKWVSTKPRLEVFGIHLEVEKMCPFTLSDMDDEECLETSTDNTHSNNNAKTIGLGVGLGAGLTCTLLAIVLLLVLLFCCAKHCRKP